MDKREIASLVEKSRQGDNAAFGELYKLTEKQAYFIVLRIAKNEDDAYDILQDCYIKAMQKIDTLENPENFVAWFNQIVSNSAKNYVVKSKPMLFRDDDDEAAVMELQVDDSLDCKPDDSLDTTETREFIRELIDELPEDKKLCVLMHYFQNMSVSQIAEELGISEGTVKTRLYYSRDKIKQSIEALEKKGIKVRGIAPIPFFIWMLKRMAEGTQVSKGAAAAIVKAATATTATAGTAAGATAATATTASSAATATTSATVTASTAATTAAVTTAATGAATGITAKVVAIAVAGAVVVGGGAVGAKVVHDKRAEETTTVQTEESTEFASENIAVIATEGNTETTIEFEGSTLTVSTKNGTTSVTVTPALNAQTTTKATTQKATEVSSTAQSTSATTKAETTTKPTTTQQTTTEKPTTTAKATTTATTKPTTTAAPTTTEPQTARVSVKIRDYESLSEIGTTDLYIDSGNTISKSWIEASLAGQYTIAPGGIIGTETVAQGGETYTFTAQVEN
ncbi:MAG: sigma-70 family RNA polymerase sigma factor [Clostridia bacterium]|nr:sigma-70 family RNA polymerase sigma factor [Clostridia bacterium]